jgi:transcriptional regulator with XRE-family HTH domain
MDIHALPFSRLNNKVLKPLEIQHVERPITIGQHIRKKRAQLRLTQKYVAEKIGVSEDSITFWENERVIPQIQFYPKIVEFLGYEPFEFDIITLGGKVKTYRLRNGLSHKQLGKILQVDASTVGAWEANTSQPKNESFRKLKELLTFM